MGKVSVLGRVGTDEVDQQTGGHRVSRFGGEAEVAFLEVAQHGPQRLTVDDQQMGESSAPFGVAHGNTEMAMTVK